LMPLPSDVKQGRLHLGWGAALVALHRCANRYAEMLVLVRDEPFQGRQQARDHLGACPSTRIRCGWPGRPKARLKPGLHG
jgi:transposase